MALLCKKVCKGKQFRESTDIHFPGPRVLDPPR